MNKKGWDDMAKILVTMPDEEERGGKEGKRGEKRGKREGKEGEGEGRKGILKLEVDEGGYFFRHEFNYYLDYDKERD